MYITPGTFYNRSSGLEVCGPVSAADWQQTKANSGVTDVQYRIRDGHLYLLNPPTAGETLAFEYASNYGIASGAGTAKQYFTADDDVLLLPDILLLRGLRWIWKKEKGLVYTEEFRNYELACNQLKGNEGVKRTLALDGDARMGGPGVIVPSGNWSV
jgi:hypothetical protein